MRLKNRQSLPASLALFLLPWMGACGNESPEGGIRVENVRVNIAPGGGSGAVYLDVVNEGSSDDRLLRAEAEGARSVQTHESLEGAGGVMRMRASPEGFEIPAGHTVGLEPGGKHIMLLGIEEPSPQVGGTLNLKLHFEKAGVIEVAAPVREYGT